MVDISVIIPVYNDITGIRDTLHSLLKIDYLDDRHEIIVVDNGSTDRTKVVAEDIATDYKHVRVLLENDIQGSYAARNKGIQHATGDILAFIDADMTVEKSWLSDLESVFIETNADYIGCNVELYFPEDKKTIIGEYNLALGFAVCVDIRKQQFAPTCCLAIRKTVINDVGPFHSDLVSGGDREFGQRVAAAGYTQHFAEDIVMRHPVRTKPLQIAKKAVRVGKGQEQIYHRYSKTAESRPWFHPYNFLPPHPITFQLRISENYSIVYCLIFYIISYCYKLLTSYGRMVERYRRIE